MLPGKLACSKQMKQPRMRLFFYARAAAAKLARMTMFGLKSRIW
jgi:hypothetical protein